MMAYTRELYALNTSAQPLNPGLDAAVSGPFRGAVWTYTDPHLIGSRDLWKCHHKHATTTEAHACAEAAIARGEAAR